MTQPITQAVPQIPQQHSSNQPIACIYKGYLYMAHEFPLGIPANALPLYAAQPERRPLTQDQIDKIIFDTNITLKNYCCDELQTKFARLVEAAHMAQPAQEPLTDDEIEAACGHNPLNYNQGFSDGVRFAESTHL